MESIDERNSRALDDALEMTFPASDPIAISVTVDNRAGETDETAGRYRPS